MDEEHPKRPQLIMQLAGGFNVGEGLNVAYGAAQLRDDDVVGFFLS